MNSRLGVVPRRRWLAAYTVAAISAAGLLTALAATAQAATTVGQTGPIGSGGCTPGNTYGNLQAQTGAPPAYTIPFDGVITSFSAAAGVGGNPTKLLILRPVSGTTYNVVAKSGTVNFTAPGVQTFPTQIAVQVGQLIGNYGYLCSLAALDPSDTFRSFNGPEPATGANQDYPNDASPARINLSANLEADCDKDGLGDETQDTNTASCLSLRCAGQRLTMVGTKSRDKIVGTAKRDVIAALGGNDKVSGLAGNDLICGGGGKDTLKGGKGNDRLYGQKGKDTLKGDAGKDKLNGGAGKDKQVQ